MSRLARLARFLLLVGPGLVSIALLALPEFVSACPSCGAGGTGRSRTAFIISTAFMTLLPFGLFGAVLLWIRRRMRGESADPLG